MRARLREALCMAAVLAACAARAEETKARGPVQEGDQACLKTLGKLPLDRRTLTLIELAKEQEELRESGRRMQDLSGRLDRIWAALGSLTSRIEEEYEKGVYPASGPVPPHVRSMLEELQRIMEKSVAIGEEIRGISSEDATRADRIRRLVESLQDPASAKAGPPR